jgi:uncharacterized membrane protein (UPF0127 family)
MKTSLAISCSWGIGEHAMRGLRVFLAAALLALAACDDGKPKVVVHGDKGAARVRVELALTAPEQARGLMWRDHLDSDAGMLFVFGRVRERSFWMKNTPLPLDIIYIDGDGKVVSIAERTTPYSTASIPSHGGAKYVLEVNGGFAAEHGVHAGSKIDLPDLASTDAN